MQTNFLPTFNNKQLIILGFLGALGACLMFVGDMLLYYSDQTAQNFADLVKIMQSIALSRTIIGALIGPIGVFFICLGFCQVSYMVKEPKWQLTIFLVLVFAFCIGGSYHSHFAYIPLLAQANELTFNAFKITIDTFFISFLVSLIIGNIGLIYLVLTKKTYYPRWFILFTPMFLFPLQPIMAMLPYPLNAIFSGGWLSIIFIIFFATSTLIIAKQKLN